MMILIFVFTFVDRPLVEITTITGGCRQVKISWTTNYNTDKCTVLYYDVALSYVTMDDNVKTSMVTTKKFATITGLPDDTQVNITVAAIGMMEVVFSVDSALVSTAVASKSMYCMCIITSVLPSLHYVCI